MRYALVISFEADTSDEGFAFARRLMDSLPETAVYFVVEDPASYWERHISTWLEERPDLVREPGS